MDLEHGFNKQNSAPETEYSVLKRLTGGGEDFVLLQKAYTPTELKQHENSMKDWRPNQFRDIIERARQRVEKAPQ